MLTGVKYGIYYFSFFPLLAFLLAGGDLRFTANKSEYFNIVYPLDFVSLYVGMLVICSALFSSYLDRLAKKISPIVILYHIDQLRANSKLYLLINIFGFSLQIIDFFVIDHSEYWLLRERSGIIPQGLAFYINPFFSFALFVGMANLCAFSALLVGKNAILHKLSYRGYVWLLLDFSYLIITVYNSGNRWYLALAFVSVYYFSAKHVRRIIIGIMPVIIMVGGWVSLYILASRLSMNLADVVDRIFYFSSFSEQMISGLLMITEGLSFGTLILLAEECIYSPDPFYILEKIASLPLPGWLFVKPLPFPILTTKLILGIESGYSLSTALPGAFIYGFGLYSIFFFMIFLVALRRFDLYLWKYNDLVKMVFFMMAFAGYRFNFDYIIVQLIYFIGIVYLQRHYLLR